MNILQCIKRDHDAVRALVEQLLHTSGDSPERRELFAQIKQELTIHADVEERNFYIPLMEDDRTQQKIRHAMAEHDEMDEALEQLEQADFGSTGWLTQAKSMWEKVEHHMQEEEGEVFRGAQDVLSEEELELFAQNYEADLQEKQDEQA